MSETRSNHIGCGTVMFLIFMTLKLTGHSDWSWWWVTSPLWIPMVIMLLIGILGALAAAIFKT